MSAILPSLIVLLTIISGISAAVLARAAVKRPRIGALTERAVIGGVIVLFGAVYSVVAFNTELSQALFAADAARVAVRILVVVLLCIPTWWTGLYLTGRLK